MTRQICVEIDGEIRPFYQASLEITTFADTGPLGFRVRVDEKQAEYEVLFKEHQVQYVPTSNTIAYLRTSTRRSTLTEWFQEEPPSITFEGTSKLEYNELFSPKSESEREPYDASKIKSRTWAGVALKRESQYKAHKTPPRLEFHHDSIQRHMIEYLLDSEDPSDYDIIFDDDGVGEIADIVALKVAGDSLLCSPVSLQVFAGAYSWCESR